MEVFFASRNLKKKCSTHDLAVREWGPDMAKRLFQRLSELRAANSLADIFRLPAPRCHALTGNRKGQFSVDLVHPYRLVFRPADEPPPLKYDGGVDVELVAAVEILRVEDYH